QLKTKIVLIKNLTKLKRIIRPRNTQPIKLRTNRSLTDSHIRPPKIKLRILQLRSQHQAKVLENLLTIIINSPLKVTRQPVLPHPHQIADSVHLRIRNIRDRQGGNILYSPLTHTNIALLPGLRFVTRAPQRANVTASNKATLPPSADSQPKPPSLPIFRRSAVFT